MNNETVNHIVNQIKILVTAAVKAVQTHRYSVDVRNYPKTQSIQGTVTVGNQGKIEDLLKQISKREMSVQNMNVENVQGPMKLEFPKELKVSNLKDIPKTTIVIPESVTVKNPQKNVTVDGLEKLQEAVLKVLHAVSSLKLDPKIEVKAPEVTVTPPQINFPEFPKTEQMEMEALKGEDPKSYVPVRLTDGKEFYEAMATVTRTLNRAITVANQDPTATYQIADKDTAGTTNYYGFTDKDENWYLMKEDETAQTFRYIAGSGNYTTAWTNRASHTYKYFHEVF